VTDGPLNLTVTLQLSNNTGRNVTDIIGHIDGITTTGDANVTLHSSQTTLGVLTDGHGASLKWQGKGTGTNGSLAPIHVSAKGRGCGGTVETGSIECPTLIFPPR
jgi:hypothetical protein